MATLRAPQPSGALGQVLEIDGSWVIALPLPARLEVYLLVNVAVRVFLLRVGVGFLGSHIAKFLLVLVFLVLRTFVE